MKRLIKFYNIYESDKANFSDCSTRYEVLPELVDDLADFEELKQLAKKHSIKLGRKQLKVNSTVTHAINTTEIHSVKRFNTVEKYQVYLGFIQIETGGSLKPSKRINRKITIEQADEIVQNCEYGVSDVGEQVDGGIIIVKQGWEYYHEMKLLGYSLESFQKALDAKEGGFSDDTSRCGECGLLDDNDDCYTNNFRVIDCDLIGVRCGCYAEKCKENYKEVFGNNSDQAMERDAAEELAKEGKLQEVETFIGGMVDGRGGYIRGKSVREGKPESVLVEYRKKYPKAVFVFTHDESGQFQTYFTIWAIVPPKSKALQKIERILDIREVA